MPTTPYFIDLPTNKTRKWQLRKKLAEYEERLTQEIYSAPELRADMICRVAILSRLLRDNLVYILDLSRETRNTYPHINASIFNKAARIINDYSRTGGQNLFYGTGLQTPPPDSMNLN